MGYERDDIAAIQGYSYGEQPPVADAIKLNTNENPYPPSPGVQRSLTAFDARQLRVYPSAMASPLRAALAEHHGLRADQVVLTHGGDEALRLAMTTFVGAGDTFGMAQPSYSLYPVLAAVQGAQICRVALGPDWLLPDDAAQTWNDQGTRLVCVVNPHAPSGTLADTAALGDLANLLNGVLLIDEAYVDFVAPERDYEATTLLAAHDNVLILRTFSKGYGLAGLRLGYLLGDAELIEPIVSKTRDSYNIDSISARLGLAALEDQVYARRIWSRVREQRCALAAALTQRGFEVAPSEANFLLAQVPDGKLQGAQQLYEALKTRNIFVRYFDEPRLSNKLRISIGTAEQNQQLLAALAEILGAAS